MTFKEMCELARIESGDLKGKLRPSTVKAQVNWAYREVAKKTHCWHTDNTASPIILIVNTENYAFTSLTGECVNLMVAEIRDATEKQTYGLDLFVRSVYIQKRKEWGLESGQPEFATWTSSGIWVCPAPDSTWAGLPLELHYAGVPIALSSDDSLLVTPPDADDAILKGATWKLRKLFGKPVAHDYRNWVTAILDLQSMYYTCRFYPGK